MEGSGGVGKRCTRNIEGYGGRHQSRETEKYYEQILEEMSEMEEKIRRGSAT